MSARVLREVPTVRNPSRRRMIADFDALIALGVPERERASVKAWVRWCGDDGLRFGWNVLWEAGDWTLARVRELASFLRRAAKGAAPAKCCSSPKGTPLYSPDSGAFLCRNCVSPLETLRPARGHR